MTDSPILYRLDTLHSPLLTHGMTTRLGGHSRALVVGLNLGHTVSDAPEHVAANHDLLFATLGIESKQVVSAHQVHGHHVALATPEKAGTVLPDTDGLITATPGIYLLMRFADCVPVLLYDPVRGAVGIAHAGWKGTLQHVVSRTVQALVDRLGCQAGNIRAGIGPSIGPCCYEIGPEVVTAARAALEQPRSLFSRHQSNGHAYLNLWAANEEQLLQASVHQIEIARLCTACRRDLFYSHRGERGHAGRFAAIIGLRANDV